MSMDEINLTNTPYDDVFRTLLNDCSSLVIPLINELFQEHYSGKETIVFSPNEHFLNRQDGNEDKRITDSSFTILGKEPKKYHLECQSSTDNSMLIPFYIFSHEKRFKEYERDEEKLYEPQKEYAFIKDRLEDLMNQGAISEFTRCAIIDMSNKVLEHIASKYSAVRKGVKSVMVGKILEYEAKTIKKEGIREGIEKGIEKGIHGSVSILKNLGIPSQTILLQIQEQYHLSPEDAQKYL